jgi:two-component system, chemotaxis family, protein-glutamate methylesterase/glutaminase
MDGHRDSDLGTFSPQLSSADGEQQAGVVCPECGGAVTVQAEGPGNPGHLLVFRCRVGHRYSTQEFLLGKEQGLEVTLWRAVYAFEELAALLRTLEARDGQSMAQVAANYRERIVLADANARAVREVIEGDRPLLFQQEPGD